MAHRILTLALATGTMVAMATLAHAQGYGGASGPGGWSGPQTQEAPPGGHSGNPMGGTTGQGTAGQSGSSGKEFAPGHNPPARDTNPGRGSGSPPGQMMNEQKTRPGSGNR
jgi:hypothetical protein